jgi:hypothetical protein
VRHETETAATNKATKILKRVRVAITGTRFDFMRRLFFD